MDKAIEQLIQDHLYLPRVVAAKYKNHGLDYEDLVQEGNIGLIKAAERFDTERGVKFSTYANIWVRQAIFEAITTKSRTIRLPNHIVSLKLKVFKFIDSFVLSVGFEPDIDLIAKELKVDKHHVEQVLSLTTEHMGAWEVSEEATIEDVVEHNDTMQHIIKALKELTPKERIIVAMKFGLLKAV